MKNSSDEDKKANGAKKCITKRKLKVEDYINCLEAAQIENEIKHLEKIKFLKDLKEDLLEFIKSNKLISKAQQRLWSEKHNCFTEEINNISLSSNDDKRIQSINSIETYAHGMSKNVVCKEKEIKCNNIIKQYKNI